MAILYGVVRLVAMYLSMMSCMAMKQLELDDLARNLEIKWQIIDNTRVELRTFSEISIYNNASTRLSKTGNWRIHLDSTFLLEPDFLPRPEGYVLPGQGVKVTHLKGSQFTLEPTNDFIDLPPGQRRKVNLQLLDWMVSKTDIMPNWFLVAPSLQPRVLASTVGDFMQPITRPEQVKRYNYDRFAPFSLEERYARFSVNAVPDTNEIRIIPKPLQMKVDKGRHSKLTQVSLVPDSGLSTETKMLVEGLKSTQQAAGPPTTVHLVLGNVSITNQHRFFYDDAYSVNIDAKIKNIVIVGVKPSGVFYGVQTLFQLIRATGGTLYDTSISDAPRYEYRGLLLDVGRNFFPKDVVMALLGKAAAYKLNKFHFHLTDDEGWRLEIPGLEELTEFGSQRCYDPDESRCLSPQLGSGPTNLTTGSGFYTMSDYKDILQFANDRHIQVIPEFDMPGHARAAVRSMEVRYKRLKNSGKEHEGMKYRLTEGNIKDPTKYLSVQMFDDNAINPCIESTYNFIGHLMEKVIAAHRHIQPLRIFDFGGDEVAKGAWDNSTACRKMSNASQVDASHVKEYFFRRVSKMAAEHDLDTAAWEDGLVRGGYNMFALSGQKEVHAYVYENIWEWGTLGRGYSMANHGYKVIMAPSTLLYFDFPSEPDPEEKGYYWATRYTDSRKTFSVLPDSIYDNIDVKRSGEPITREEACGKNDELCPPLLKPENIIGIQGHLWGDTIIGTEDMHTRAFPRIFSLAERAWHKADWQFITNKTTRAAVMDNDWSSFVRAVGLRELPWLDAEGILYRVAPPGARVSGGVLVPEVEFPGLQVQYQDIQGNWQDVAENVTVDKPLRTRTRDGKRFSRVVKYTKIPVFVDQPTLDDTARSLQAMFTLGRYSTNTTLFLGDITLYNNGSTPIHTGNWGVYFNSLARITAINRTSQMTFTNLGRSLYVLKPTKEFSPLFPRSHITITGRFSGGPFSRHQMMPNWFVAAEGMEPRVISNTAGESLNFVAGTAKELSFEKRYEHNPDVPKNYTPSHRYGVPYYRLKTLIPTPEHTMYDMNDTVDLSRCCWTVYSDHWTIYSDSSLMKEGAYLQDEMRKLGLPPTTLHSKTNTHSPPYTRYIELEASSVHTDQSDNYIMTTYSKKRTSYIRISGSPVGVFNGIQSLLSLIARSNGAVGSIPALKIHDRPRFAYRGLRLDVASNFFKKETIYRVLDAMALYKLNKLQLRLADDSAWRVEIPGLPELVQIGGQRCFDEVRLHCLLPQFGSGPTNTTLTYYTRQDYQDIVKHAARRHIEVIPEFSFPGHSHAAVQAMEERYQRFADVGDHLRAEKFMLSKLHPGRNTRITSDTADTSLPSVYAFFTHVVNELYSMHANINTLGTIHIGGDPSWPKGRDPVWKTTVLGSTVLTKLSAITASKNVTLSGTTDIFTEAGGQLVPRQKLAGRVTVHDTSPVWDKGQGSKVASLVNNGYEVVESSIHLDLGYPYEQMSEERGLDWNVSATDTSSIFSFVDGPLHPANGLKDGTATGNILGIQCRLETPVIRTEEELFYMLFPRLLAFAEKAWHKQSINAAAEERRYDWLTFAATVGSEELLALQRMNFTYRLPLPGAKLSDDKSHVLVNSEFPGLPIEVSMDNGHSWTPVDAKGIRVIPLEGSTVLVRTRVNQRTSRAILLKIPVLNNTGSHIIG